MKNKSNVPLVRLFGIIALVAVMVSVTGCVTTTTVGGTADQHGWLSSLIFFPTGKVIEEGGTEIAQYMVIVGMIDLGYNDYVTKVRAADKANKKMGTTATTYFGVVTIIKAYTY
jgi:hypothetical protein